MRPYRYAYLVISFLLLIQVSLVHAQDFSQGPISEKLFEAMKDGNTFHEDSPVPKERLRLLKVQYVDFSDNTQTGQLVVLDACADQVLEIFKALYKRRFPIGNMNLMHHYHGEDDQAMADNNTSCHNCRSIKGKDRFSLHAYGTAIDINPVQNPCAYINEEAGVATYEPTSGIEYANRCLKRPGKAYRKGLAEEVVDVFAKYGFYWWGGYWDDKLDYQHFHLSRSMTELYVVMDPLVAKATFLKATCYYNKQRTPLEPVLLQELAKVFPQECSLAECYQQDPMLFNQVLENLVRSPEYTLIQHTWTSTDAR